MGLDANEKERARYTRKSIAKGIVKNDNSDVSDIAFTMYVGTGGHLKVDTFDGQTIVLKNVPSGSYIDWIKIKRIYSKGTSASDIVAIY